MSEDRCSEEVDMTATSIKAVDADVEMEDAYDSDESDVEEDSNDSEGSDSEDGADEEEPADATLPDWNAIAQPLHSQNSMSTSSTPELEYSRYGNPFAPWQRGNVARTAIQAKPALPPHRHANDSDIPTGETQSDQGLSSSVLPDSDVNAASAPVTDDAKATAEPTPPPSKKNWSEAQDFWSNRPNLGFGFGTPRKDLYKTFKDLKDDNAIAGAPMRNEFYRPEAANEDATPEADADEDADDQPSSASIAQDESTRGRGSARGSRGQRGRGRRSWKWALKNTEHDSAQQKAKDKAERRRTRGSNEGRGRGRPRGPSRKAVDPGREFKKFQTEATIAFMDDNLDVAFQAARQAVQANPEVYAAHSLLSEILLRMDRKEDALAALMSGANTKRDPELWILVAQRTVELAGEDITDTHRAQALFAYSHAVKCCPLRDEHNNYIARTGKRDMHLELHDYNEAKNQSRSMLNLDPGDLDNIKTFAELCADTKDPVAGEFERAKEAYEGAFDLLEQNEIPEDTEEMWSHLNCYLEVVDKLGTLDKTTGFVDLVRIAQAAIQTLRRLARRILGRKEETFWDDYPDDDREWDSGQNRRGLVPEFQQGRASRDRAAYGDGLPLEIRVKLGIFRLKMGMRHHQEGLNHLEHLMLMSDEMEHFYDIFLHVADTLRSCRLWTHAVRFYEAIKATLDVEDESFFMGSAECYIELGRTPDAEENYRWLISVHQNHIPARIELAKMYEKIGYKEYALPLVKEVMKLGRKDLIVRADLLPQKQPRARKVPKKVPVPKPVPDTTQSHQNLSEVLAESSGPLKPAKVVKTPKEKAPKEKAPKEKAPKRTRKPATVLQNIAPTPNQQFGSFASPMGTPVIATPIGMSAITAPIGTSAIASQTGMPTVATPFGTPTVATLIGTPAAVTPIGIPDKFDARSNGPTQSQTPTPSLGLFTSPAPSRGDNYYKRAAERSQRIQIQAQLIELQYRKLKRYWPAVEEGVDEKAVTEWIDAATAMVFAFRQMDVFYPRRRTDRHRTTQFKGYVVRNKGFRNKASTEQLVNTMYDRLRDDGDESDGNEGNEDTGQQKTLHDLHPSIPRDFHGIAFDEWHRIFVDLALLHAKAAEQEKCYELLQSDLLYINVFTFDPVFHNTSLAASICCALMFNDSEFINDIGRKYVGLGDNRAGGAYQLFSAGNRFCYQNRWFTAGPTQKFMCRMVKSVDYTLMPPAVRDRIDHGGQGPNLKRRHERIGQGNGELDPGLLMLYGNMLAESNNHSVGALAYYYRALALLPESFCIHLSISSVYIQSAMRKRTDNRHFGIQQGLSFLRSYYELRTASGRVGHLQEAEYNMAKTWHVLGLMHLAIPAFEKVLALSEGVRTEAAAAASGDDDGGVVGAEDFAVEAAFALQQLYALAGNDEAARAISEEWLVL